LIVTYTADTIKAKQINETTGLKLLRRIIDKTRSNVRKTHNIHQMSEGVTRNKKNKKETNITAISPDRPPEGRGTGHQKRWKDNIENRQQPVVESKRRRRRRRRRKRWPNIY
jgi:hypothetical protein